MDWRLDLLRLSLTRLLQTLTEVAERGIGFQSLNVQIYTTSVGGTDRMPVEDWLAKVSKSGLKLEKPP